MEGSEIDRSLMESLTHADDTNKNQPNRSQQNISPGDNDSQIEDLSLRHYNANNPNTDAVAQNVIQVLDYSVGEKSPLVHIRSEPMGESENTAGVFSNGKTNHGQGLNFGEASVESIITSGEALVNERDVNLVNTDVEPTKPGVTMTGKPVSVDVEEDLADKIPVESTTENNQMPGLIAVECENNVDNVAEIDLTENDSEEALMETVENVTVDLLIHTELHVKTWFTELQQESNLNVSMFLEKLLHGYLELKTIKETLRVDVGTNTDGQYLEKPNSSSNNHQKSTSSNNRNRKRKNRTPKKLQIISSPENSDLDNEDVPLITMSGSHRTPRRCQTAKNIKYNVAASSESDDYAPSIPVNTSRGKRAPTLRSRGGPQVKLLIVPLSKDHEEIMKYRQQNADYLKQLNPNTGEVNDDNEMVVSEINEESGDEANMTGKKRKKSSKPAAKKSIRSGVAKRKRSRPTLMGPKQYACNKCDSKFTKKYELRNHRKTHIIIPKFRTCPYCTFTGDQIKEVKDHIADLHADKYCETNKQWPWNFKQFKCDFCEEVFSSKRALSDHQRQKEHREKNNQICEVCGKLFMTVRNLRDHQLVVHGEKHIHCTYEGCNLRFSKAGALQQHIRRKHLQIRRKTCDYEGCGLKFFEAKDLKRHIIVHHTGERNYKCDYPGCDKSFKSEYHRKVHFRIHSDEKPLKCPYCDYRGRQRNSLNVHLKKHQKEGMDIVIPRFEGTGRKKGPMKEKRSRRMSNNPSSTSTSTVSTIPRDLHHPLQYQLPNVAQNIRDFSYPGESLVASSVYPNISNDNQQLFNQIQSSILDSNAPTFPSLQHHQQFLPPHHPSNQFMSQNQISPDSISPQTSNSHQSLYTPPAPCSGHSSMPHQAHSYNSSYVPQVLTLPEQNNRQTASGARYLFKL